MEGVQRHLSLVVKTQYCPVLMSRGGWYQVTVSLLPFQSSPVSYHGSNGAPGRECPLICCVMGPVNSCWTCSDARNIGRYNSSRYDSVRYTQYRFRYNTDPIIARSLVHSQNTVTKKTQIVATGIRILEIRRYCMAIFQLCNSHTMLVT